MSKYETKTGYVSRDETYLKLMHHLREAQDQAAVLSHLHHTDVSKFETALANGWLKVSMMLGEMTQAIQKLAANKFS